MFNNILSPFSYDNHVEFSAFYQKNIKDYATLLKEMDSTIKNNCESINSNDLTSENETVKTDSEFIISSIVHKIKNRLISVPSLYNFICQLDFNKMNLETEEIDINLIEAVLNKNVWRFPEQILNVSFSSISNTNSNSSIGLLEDYCIKDIVLKRQIDICINLDSFVKLILCHLKDLNDDCYIPFLKLNIDERKGNCLIFDKSFSKHPNIGKEKLKYLKHLILENCKKPDLFQNERSTRITKSNLGIKFASSNDELKNFINNTNPDKYEQIVDSYNLTRKAILEKCIENTFDKSNPNIKNQNCEIVEIDHSSKYSYAIWDLMGLNVLFRFKNFYRILNENVASQKPECAYVRVLLDDNEVKNNSEEIWKSFFGSKINLDSDIMQIILNMEAKCIKSVNKETMEEFISKNTVINSKYQSVLIFLKNCFDSIILSNKFDPDFYLLHLTNNNIGVYRSTDEENKKELDLRNFYNFD